MYIPDNYDAYRAYEAERERQLRIHRKIQADEERADRELPWVTVPDDYGKHNKNLYFEEEYEE
jgi:hypothetical protein